MSTAPDDPRDRDEEHDVHPGDEPDRDRPLDIDARFADIVAHYGTQPEDGPATGGPAPEAREPGALSERFRARGWSEQAEDPLNSPASWEDEGHFIPPDPPPLPRPEPRRLMAWLGLLGAPVAMLLIVTLSWHPPTLVTLALVLAFLGGFGYLVATMNRTPRDPWSGDDGAVL